MKRNDYIDQVLSNVHRVTPKERAAIREELAGHLEDHAQGLLDLGIREEFPNDFWAIARDAGGAEVSCRKVEDFMSLVEKLLS